MTKNKIILPKTLQQKDIDFLTQGKGNPEWEKFIGKPKISYSDINLFLDSTYSSNPIRDYVLQQFLKVPSVIHSSFGEFGHAMEDYICKRENNYGFTEPELKVLEQIEPLGTYQTGFLIDFNDFSLVGLTDDMCFEDCNEKVIRDYKSASESSYLKRYADKKNNLQLNIYALEWMENKGIIPHRMELVTVERKGNPFKSEKLTVGENIWTKEYIVTKEELLILKQQIIDTVNLISEYYKIFTKINV